MAKVLISMPDDFLNRIDNFAAAEQRSRSELIREALRTYLRRNLSTNRELNEKNAKALEDLLN